MGAHTKTTKTNFNNSTYLHNEKVASQNQVRQLHFIKEVTIFFKIV